MCDGKTPPSMVSLSLATERYTVAGHVVERCRTIPSSVRIARIRGEVRRARRRCSAVDRRDENEIRIPTNRLVELRTRFEFQRSFLNHDA